MHPRTWIGALAWTSIVLAANACIYEAQTIPHGIQNAVLKADRTSIPASSGQVANLTFTLTLASGEVAAGYTVDFSTTSGDGAFSVPSTQTDSTGTAQTQISSSVAAHVGVFAQVTLGSSRLSSDVLSLTFTAPTIEQLTLTATPNTVVVGAATVLQVRATDTFGNPVAGAPVAFDVDGTQNSFDGAGITAVDGTYTTTLVSTTAQTKTVNAATGDVHAAPTMVNYVAGPPDATASFIDANPDTLAAMNNASSVITAHITDAYGNPLAGQRVSFLVSGTGNTFSPNQLAGVTDNTGQWSFTIASIYAGVKIVKGTTQSFTVTGAVTFTATTTPTCALPGQGGYPAPPGTNTNATVSALTIGDINGDGLADVISVSATGSNISVGISAAHGNQPSTHSFSVASLTASPAALSVADFTGDGNVDIAVTSASANNLSIYNGNGAGLFALGQNVTLSGAYLLAKGNINKDGLADLAVAGNQNVYFLVQTAGNMIVSSSQHFSSNVLSLALGQLRKSPLNDDMAVSAQDGNLYVLNNVMTVYTLKQTVPLGGSVNAVAIADFTKDGNNDIGAANGSTNSVQVLVGFGGGTFAAPTSYATSVSAPSGIGAGDFNGDGQVDVVTLAGTGIDIFFGTGTGSMSVVRHQSLGTTLQGIASGTLNSDAFPDLVVGAGQFAMPLLNSGSGSFLAPSLLTDPSAPTTGAVGDVNNDGNQDLVTLEFNTSQARVRLGNGDGTFATAVNYPVAAAPQIVTLVDINQDGNQDIVVVANTMQYLLGKGAGVFASAATLPSGISGVIAFADLNGDNLQDYVIAQSNYATVYLQRGSLAFAANGNLATSGGATTMTIADFNFDGTLDVALSALTGLTFYFGAGDGNFSASPIYLAGARTTQGAAADINGDGHLDFVVPWGANAIAELLNAGDGNFTSITTYPNLPTLNYPSLQVVDLNGDSHLDVITSGYRPQVGPIVYLGDGTGALGAGAGYLFGLDTQSVSVADFNNDGKLDMLGTAYDAQVIAVGLYNACY